MCCVGQEIKSGCIRGYCGARGMGQCGGGSVWVRAHVFVCGVYVSV